MPLQHNSIVFDVVDCKVYPMTADPPGGASSTYGSGIDLPGIRELGVDPNLASAEIKGDGVVFARKAKVDRVNLTVTHSKIDLDILLAIHGGTITDTATTKSVWSLTQANNALGYFKLEAQITDTDFAVGDVHVVGYKCQLDSSRLFNQAPDSFGSPNFGMVAFPTSAGGKMLDVVFNSTVTPVV